MKLVILMKISKLFLEFLRQNYLPDLSRKIKSKKIIKKSIKKIIENNYLERMKEKKKKIQKFDRKFNKF